MDPEYELETTDLYGHDLAVFVCRNCYEEWMADAEKRNPEYCPYCGTQCN